MKGNKGITLIALIVTIIVIIIIAGISVNLLLGENGLIQRAKDAKAVYTQTELEERVNLAYLDYKMQKETGRSVSLESILSEIEGVTVTALAAETSNDTFCIEKDGLKVTVNTQGDVSEGEVKVWKGLEDIKCPRIENGTWYIDEPAQLNFLAYYVNNGCSVTGTEKDLTDFVPSGTTVSMNTSTMIELTNDLDMGARLVNGKVPTDVDTAYETANASVKWTPIGTDRTYVEDKLGTFNGNNHTIKNLYVNRTENFNGIFGNSNTIKSLTIINSYIKGGTCTGGIVGALRSGYIENSQSINTTSILIGENSFNLAGLVGQASGDVINCTNSGTIISYANYSSSGNPKAAQVGGIVGRSATYELDTIVKDCVNTGNIYMKGIANVKSMSIGGICGITDGMMIEDCKNSGNIVLTDKYEAVGGIVGRKDNGTIKECTNIGNIIKSSDSDVNNFVGGIVGYLVANSSNGTGMSIVEKCYNSGSVVGDNRVGGIVGYVVTPTSGSSNTVKECYNKGTVTGMTNETGSIVGIQSATTVNTYIDLYYQSTVGIGAINGVDDNTKYIGPLTAPDGNFNSKEEFLTWLDAQKASRANS